MQNLSRALPSRRKPASTPDEPWQLPPPASGHVYSRHWRCRSGHEMGMALDHRRERQHGKNCDCQAAAHPRIIGQGQWRQCEPDHRPLGAIWRLSSCRTSSSSAVAPEADADTLIHDFLDRRTGISSSTVILRRRLVPRKATRRQAAAILNLLCVDRRPRSWVGLRRAITSPTRKVPFPPLTSCRPLRHEHCMAFRKVGIAATSETSYDAQSAQRTLPGRSCAGPL